MVGFVDWARTTFRSHHHPPQWALPVHLAILGWPHTNVNHPQNCCPRISAAAHSQDIEANPVIRQVTGVVLLLAC